jgi:hypothetical protein
MEIVQTNDTGTLQYEIYFNDDQSECVVLERYRDSEALIEHATHLGDLMEAVLATGSVSGELLGEPSAGLRAKTAGSEVLVAGSIQRRRTTVSAYTTTMVSGSLRGARRGCRGRSVRHRAQLGCRASGLRGVECDGPR